MNKAMPSERILIIEDEEIIRTSLRKLLERHDYVVSDAVSIKAARENFNINDFALIISDLRLPGQPGTDLIKLADPAPVLIMTSYASLRSAVDTMRQGAVDYISKPFDHDEMMASIRRILQSTQKNTSKALTLDDIALLGSSEAIKKVTRLIAKVAHSDLPILITGETGSGKSAVATAIGKARQPGNPELIKIDCAGLKEHQLVSRLQESESGAVVFINNIAELELSLQPLLLRELHLGKHYFICSSDQDLERLCRINRFRKDLYYHINVVSIAVPPLRQRGEDLLTISETILNGSDNSPELSREGRQALLDYQWPGNVLQLKNVLQQAIVLTSPGQPIDTEQLGLNEGPLQVSGELTPSASAPQRSSDDAPAGLSLEDYFTRFVLENQENMSETDLAKKLGISRKSLWERRNKLGISRKRGDDQIDN